MAAFRAPSPDNGAMGELRDKPDIAVGDGVTFENADGQYRHGRIVAIFDARCTVEEESSSFATREDIAFEQIRVSNRTAREAGRGFVI